MLSEETDVLEIAGRPAIHLWKSILEVNGQALDELGAPPMSLLALLNFAAKAVLQLHQLGIDGQGSALPGLDDIAFKLGQPVGVTLGQCGSPRWAHAHTSSSCASASGRRN